jgi:hypothetical protein
MNGRLVLADVIIVDSDQGINTTQGIINNPHSLALFSILHDIANNLVVDTLGEISPWPFYSMWPLFSCPSLFCFRLHASFAKGSPFN